MYLLKFVAHDLEGIEEIWSVEWIAQGKASSVETSGSGNWDRPFCFHLVQSRYSITKAIMVTVPRKKQWKLLSS
jgi:hypothetical protein